MPLSDALKARLLKRGLLQGSGKSNSDFEEVIAEDYSGDRSALSEVFVRWTPDCPNRSNPYHECTDYCEKRYGLKAFLPNLDDERKRQRMLRLYPLPEGWIEVADPTKNRFYYASKSTGNVCWLSPSHPRAKPGPPADKLKDRSAVESRSGRSDRDRHKNRDRDRSPERGSRR